MNIKELFNDIKEPFNDIKEPFNDIKEPYNDIEEPFNDIEELFNNIEDSFNNYKQLESNYLHQLDNGSTYTVYELKNYYNQQEKTNFRVKKYERTIIKNLFIIARETNDIELLENISNYYCDNRKYIRMKKCCMSILEKDVHNITANICLTKYFKYINNYEKMMYHYNMIIDKSTYILNEIAFYYEDIKNCYEVIKYYLINIDKKDTTAMFLLGYYYEEIQNYDSAKKYYEMALNNNISNIYHDIINKSLYKINSMKECLICYNINIHTSFTCGHEICINCFTRVDNCYYRC
jgi:tetratricopeptide (TPR) repeat protein